MEGLPLKTSWELIWRADKKLSPVAQAFVSHLKRSKTSIIERHFKGYATLRSVSHHASPTPENDPCDARPLPEEPDKIIDVLESAFVCHMLNLQITFSQ